MTPFNCWDMLTEVSAAFRQSVRATPPVGDEDMGYFVNVQGMQPEELAEIILQWTGGDPNMTAMLAAAAVSALVLRDYQHEDKPKDQGERPA